MSVDLDRLAFWEDKYLSGDHSDDEWCASLLRRGESVSGIPLLFRAASQIETLSFLEANGVDLLQADENGSTLLFEPQTPFDLDVYRWLAAEFARRGAVDRVDEEGFSALSVMVKFGERDKAKALLENGAAIDTTATVARYGGKRVTVPLQAVECQPLDGSSDEETSVALLQLLHEHGFKPGAAEIDALADHAGAERPRLRDWIRHHLSGGDPW